MALNDNEVYARLRARYCDRLAGELLVLQERSQALGENLDPGLLPVLCAQAHALAGSGGTFGFPLVSEAAAALEDALRCNTDISIIRAAAQQLMQAMAAAINDGIRD